MYNQHREIPQDDTTHSPPQTVPGQHQQAAAQKKIGPILKYEDDLLAICSPNAAGIYNYNRDSMLKSIAPLNIPFHPPETKGNREFTFKTTYTGFYWNLLLKQLLRKLRDLDLSNVEATPHVEPRIASPLPPPILEDVHPQAQSPGTYPPGRIPSWELTTSRPISIYNLFESYIDVLASTIPTTRYYKVPYFYLTSLDLLGTPSRVTISSPQPLLGHSCPRSRFP
ncbi:hypothetical protein F5879DRAFT_995360 [Lentinula edodes]|nr:hypothetical protein F5879DRAFT_995360 [Lentinula edodes]